MYSWKQRFEAHITFLFFSKRQKMTKFEFVHLDEVETNNRIPGFLDFIMKPNGNLKWTISNVKKYEKRECC